MRVALYFLAFALALGGCANISTVDRKTMLPTDEGVAIHLDAPQRLVIKTKDGKICAEPTPDALQAYAHSLGAGLSVPTEGAVSLSNALQANSLSTGLHTQSITLMRDALYRICEGYASGALLDRDVVQLIQRSQDLTLAVLTIEQLTGAVVARQGALTGTANASSSANVANTQAALDMVKKAEENKKKALDDAKASQDKADAALKQTQADLAAEQKKPIPDATVITKLTDQQKTQSDALSKAKDAANSANEDYKAAQKATQAVLDNFNAAVTSANAATTGSSAFATAADRNNVDKDTVAQLTDAAKDIVRQVVSKSHLTDNCMNLMNSYARGDAKQQAALKPIFDQCTAVISAYLVAYTNYYNAAAQKPDPNNPPPKPGDESKGPPAVVTPTPPSASAALEPAPAAPRPPVAAAARPPVPAAPRRAPAPPVPAMIR